MKANKVMHGTDIAGFLPKEDPNSWKEHELDESLVQLLLDRVSLRAVFWPLSRALIWCFQAQKNHLQFEDGRVQARMDVYKHLFARDWERLAEQMSAPSAHVGRLQQELEDAAAAGKDTTNVAKALAQAHAQADTDSKFWMDSSESRAAVRANSAIRKLRR